MYADPEVDVNSRREFLILEDAQTTRGKREAGDFEFSAHQLFVANFVNPFTKNRRVHLKSGTGVGKTIASLLAAKEFIKLDRQVLIIGFQEQRFYDELMTRVELGYVTAAEVTEMSRLRQIYDSMKSDEALNRLKNMRAAVKRRFNQHITIQGYKKFMHELLGVEGSDNPQINFGIVEKYRHGLVIYDESQNAYNAEERNNWGRAIQFLLNTLGPDVHALSVSATPVTISSELRDFLHLMTETPRMDVTAIQTAIEDADAAAGQTSDVSGRAAPEVIKLVNDIIDFKHPDLIQLILPQPITEDVIITRLRGKILYMPDAILEHIPHRIYHGESISDIRYLKFTRVVMAPDQETASRANPTNHHLRDLGGLLAGYTAGDNDSAAKVGVIKDSKTIGGANSSSSDISNNDDNHMYNPTDDDSSISGGFAITTGGEVFDRVDEPGENESIPQPSGPWANDTDIAAAFLDDTMANTGVVNDNVGEDIIAPDTTQLAEHQLQLATRRVQNSELIQLNMPELAKYREKIGAMVLRTDVGLYLSGSILREPGLAQYSTKYSKMLEIVRGARMGKILIYHNEVHGMGVLTLQEVFRQNGIIGAADSPNDFTLCTYCSKPRKEHKSHKTLLPPFDPATPHAFVPMRYLSVSSAISNVQARDITETYNRPQNLWGQEFRIMLGSRKIREGTDYKAVQTQIVMSLPGNIAILIQLFGRSARNYSHVDLPVENNYVHLYILVSSYRGANGQASSELSPEEIDYKNKMEDYLTVQRYDMVMNRIAVDAYILHTPEWLLKSIKANLAVNDSVIAENMDHANPTDAPSRKSADDEVTMRLGPQPYTLPHRERIAASLVKNTTYYALERFTEEMNTIQYLINLALNEKNIWCIDALWDYVKKSKGTPNPAMFEFTNYLASLRTMDNLRVVGNYVIYGAGDIEEHSRRRVPHESIKLMQISYFKDEQLLAAITTRIDSRNSGAITLMHTYDIYEQYSLDVHLRVIRRVIADDNTAGLGFYATLFKLYTAKDMRQSTASSSKIVGYNYANHMYYLEHGSKTWKEMNYTESANENNIVIGMYTPSMQFKLRTPQKYTVIDKAAAVAKDVDMRKIERGVVCKTKNKKDLFNIARKLDIDLSGIRDRIPSLCDEIKLELLRRESRHTGGFRWVYLHE